MESNNGSGQSVTPRKAEPVRFKQDSENRNQAENSGISQFRTDPLLPSPVSIILLIPTIRGEGDYGMTVSKQPSFLPQYPLDPVAYDRLYAFNHGTDDYSEQTRRWKEIRLKPGLSEIEVYRKLPHASGFEYGGYVTQSRIRFHRCEATRAFVLGSKLCTFHSHPTSHKGAGVPSIAGRVSLSEFPRTSDGHGGAKVESGSGTRPRRPWPRSGRWPAGLKPIC